VELGAWFSSLVSWRFGDLGIGVAGFYIWTRSFPVVQTEYTALRRTAKTLMVRAGERSDISERVLGPAIAIVEGTYDRHSYADEKRDALGTIRRFD